MRGSQRRGPRTYMRMGSSARKPDGMSLPLGETCLRIKPSLPLVVLLILSFEKFVQHVVVTYAFWRNASGIREWVVVDYRILMISGFIVGILFLINISFLIQRIGSSFAALFFLALFDCVGEFIAQGTLAIEITVSFLVASAILLILVFCRKRLVQPNAPSAT
jgi:hypothetical protein